MFRKYSKNSASRLGAPPACERWKCLTHVNLHLAELGIQLVARTTRNPRMKSWMNGQMAVTPMQFARDVQKACVSPYTGCRIVSLCASEKPVGALAPGSPPCQHAEEFASMFLCRSMPSTETSPTQQSL